MYHPVFTPHECVNLSSGTSLPVNSGQKAIKRLLLLMKLLLMAEAGITAVSTMCVYAAQQQQVNTDMTEAKSVAVAGSQLDVIDRACILTAVVLITSCFITAIILRKCTSQWHFSAGICHLCIVLSILVM